MKLDGIRIGGQRMKVGYKEPTVIVVLHTQKLTQGSEIVAQMQIAGRAYATQNYFFLFIGCRGSCCIEVSHIISVLSVSICLF